MLHGGERVREERYIAPTLVEGDPDSALMQEEIFAPVLPLIEVSDLEAALRFIAERPKPLAAYLFSRSNTARRKLIERSQSGSVAFNDVIVQAGVPGLPFGGVAPAALAAAMGKLDSAACPIKNRSTSGPLLLIWPGATPPTETGCHFLSAYSADRGAHGDWRSSFGCLWCAHRIIRWSCVNPCLPCWW